MSGSDESRLRQALSEAIPLVPGRPRGWRHVVDDAVGTRRFPLSNARVLVGAMTVVVVTVIGAAVFMIARDGRSPAPSPPAAQVYTLRSEVIPTSGRRSMSLRIPAGWHAIAVPGGVPVGTMAVMRVANYPLVPNDTDLGTRTEARIPVGGIMVAIYAPFSQWRTAPRMPLQVHRSDFGPFEDAMSPHHARFKFRRDGIAFGVDVAVGQPAGTVEVDQQLINRVNAVLSTFTLSRRP